MSYICIKQPLFFLSEWHIVHCIITPFFGPALLLTVFPFLFTVKPMRKYSTKFVVNHPGNKSQLLPPKRASRSPKS
jgi:hypothetical protein